MNDRWTVPLPSQTCLALAAYLQESGSGADASEVAAMALDQWLTRAQDLDKPRAPALPAGSTLRRVLE